VAGADEVVGVVDEGMVGTDGPAAPSPATPPVHPAALATTSAPATLDRILISLMALASSPDVLLDASPQRTDEPTVRLLLNGQYPRSAKKKPRRRANPLDLQPGGDRIVGHGS
jgi:hypothetical protein